MTMILVFYRHCLLRSLLSLARAKGRGRPQRGHLLPVELPLQLLEGVQQLGQIEMGTVGLGKTGPVKFF